MRQHEFFHKLAVPVDSWTIIRVDGRSFTKMTEQAGFERPFDARFHDAMTKTACELVAKLSGIYAFTESDEISILLPYDTDLFSREVEKLVSVSAGIASAAFTFWTSAPAHFDSRLWIGPTRQHVIDYFRWRQSDAHRCGLNGWAYWTLRKVGATFEEATATLEGKDVAFKNELLFQHDINFNEVPEWQKRGTGVVKRAVPKRGVDPRTNETRETSRRVFVVEEKLPFGEDYSTYVNSIIDEWFVARTEE